MESNELQNWTQWCVSNGIFIIGLFIQSNRIQCGIQINIALN